jgi:hypothetical protein
MIGSGMPINQSSAPLPKPITTSIVEPVYQRKGPRGVPGKPSSSCRLRCARCAPALRLIAFRIEFPSLPRARLRNLPAALRCRCSHHLTYFDSEPRSS